MNNDLTELFIDLGLKNYVKHKCLMLRIGSITYRIYTFNITDDYVRILPLHDVDGRIDTVDIHFRGINELKTELFIKIPVFKSIYRNKQISKI